MNNVPDINIVKYLSLNIKKAFDKGEIDKVYRDIYDTAVSFAARDTKPYVDKTMLKWQEELRSHTDNLESPASRVCKMVDYKNERIQFHLDQMYKLLELYAKSKSSDSSK